MFIDKVKNFCDHSMILREMAANQKPIGTLWPPPRILNWPKSPHRLGLMFWLNSSHHSLCNNMSFRTCVIPNFYCFQRARKLAATGGHISHCSSFASEQDWRALQIIAYINESSWTSLKLITNELFTIKSWLAAFLEAKLGRICIF